MSRIFSPPLNTGSQCSASSVAASLLGLAAASPAMGKPKGRHGRIATGGVQAQCYMPRPRHHASFLMRQGPKLRCIARHANTRRRGDALTYLVNPESSDPPNTLKLCAGLRIWNPNHACWVRCQMGTCCLRRNSPSGCITSIELLHPDVK